MEKRFLQDCLTVQIEWTVSMNVAASCSPEGRKLRTSGALRISGFQVLSGLCRPVRLMLSSAVLSKVLCYLVHLALSCVIPFCLQVVYE